MTSARTLFCLLDLSGRTVVVAGAGRAAAIKLKALKPTGCRVRMVAPAAAPATLKLLKAWPAARWIRRKAAAGDLKACDLLVLATGDPACDAALTAAARRRGVWVLSASVPARGDLTLPATARAGRLRVAVSTSGASPKLAKALAASVALAFGRSGLGELAARLGRSRDAARAGRAPR